MRILIIISVILYLSWSIISLYDGYKHKWHLTFLNKYTRLWMRSSVVIILSLLVFILSEYG
jgi:hypothetical protein